ncbi:MAG: CBS domain-containing protein [Deltaproteobacteria bacterium]|nr:CBS domain-containing protein [Deltaproteobacteria bacterium]MBW1793027.1 CBS domain-containing protein [Deltaproteobacteria bacterium]MBW2329589.1 CBS domain-containing protein [Deltaproteobacteria bacterium]
MLSVKDIMTRDVIAVSPEMDIAHAARLLLEKSINGVPVVDGTGKLVGILCQSDLVAQQKKFPIPTLFTFLDGFIPMTSMKHLEKEVQKITAITVADAMSPNPVSIRPGASIEEVCTIMVDRNFHTLPVVDKGKLVGILGKEDVLRTLMPAPEAR